MKLGDTWQEGEVVERQAARVAYEDFLHRRQDPALLEQGPGNDFSARVFPIPAQGTKEALPLTRRSLCGERPGRLRRLRGLPEIGRASIQVTDGSAPSPRFFRERFVPDADFTLAAGHPRVEALRSGDLVLVRARVPGESHPEPVESLLVLLDTSASRALGVEQDVRQLRELVQKVAGPKPNAFPLTIAGFDQTVTPLYSGTAAGFDDATVGRILARGALGASNLEQALQWATSYLGHAKRVWAMTDGVATAGDTSTEKLAAAARGLRATGVQRLDALAVGALRDTSTLAALVRAGLRADGVVADAKEGALPLARRLGKPGAAPGGRHRGRCALVVANGAHRGAGGR